MQCHVHLDKIAGSLVQEWQDGAEKEEARSRRVLREITEKKSREREIVLMHRSFNFSFISLL